MTDKEAYEDGRAGYARGWKAIPPARIAAIRMFISLTWIQGWKDERDGRPIATEYAGYLKTLEFKRG